MSLDPTIIRTRTSTSLLKLLTACKKYLKHNIKYHSNKLNKEKNKRAEDILRRIEKAEKVHKEEMERVGNQKYED